MTSILTDPAENQNISINVVRSLLDEDKFIVAYRPSWRSMTGSVTSAILLQQIRYHWVKNDRKPFFKFFYPSPNNQAYKKGCSLAEELGFSKGEMRGAFKKVGRRVKKIDFDDTDPLKNIFFGYFQDQDHLNWFYFNDVYFEENIIKHYSKFPHVNLASGNFPHVNLTCGYPGVNLTPGSFKDHDNDHDNDHINKLISIGFDPAGAKKLNAIYDNDRPFGEIVNLWYQKYGDDPIPAEDIGYVYHRILNGNPPAEPESEYIFSTITQDQAKTAIKYWQEKGQNYKDADMAHALMVSEQLRLQD